MKCEDHSGDDLPPRNYPTPNFTEATIQHTDDPLPAGGAAVQLVGVLEGDHSLLEPHDLDTDSHHSARHTL